LSHRATLNSWGFSPLNQINKANVARLSMVWTPAMGPGVQEGMPLVYKGVMYLPNPSDFIQVQTPVSRGSGQIYSVSQHQPQHVGAARVSVQARP